jgi:hypothetical protein
MSEKRPDGFTMIGLHKLAAHGGDGLVPELHEMLQQHAERQQFYPNVTLFPAWEARMPGEAATKPLGPAAANGNNILSFSRWARKARKQSA